MKKKVAYFVVCVLVFTASVAGAEWVVYEQAEKDGPWQEFRAVDKYDYAKNQVKASCVVKLYSENYAVKIEDVSTGKAETFLCDDINNAAQQEEAQKAEAAKAKQENGSEAKQIKLW